jgi:hypothetical protein
MVRKQQQRNGVFCTVRAEMLKAGQLVSRAVSQSVSQSVEWNIVELVGE